MIFIGKPTDRSKVGLRGTSLDITFDSNTMDFLKSARFWCLDLHIVVQVLHRCATACVDGLDLLCLFGVL